MPLTAEAILQAAASIPLNEGDDALMWARTALTYSRAGNDEACVAAMCCARLTLALKQAQEELATLRAEQGEVEW